MSQNNNKNPDGPLIIKRYRNRRLFNTQTRNYITLDELARMAKEGQQFEVQDGPTRANITRAVLTRIVLEADANGRALLSDTFLRQLISFYGGINQRLVPQYLALVMACFTDNQERIKGKVDDALVRSMFERNRQTLVQRSGRGEEAA